MPNYSYPFKGRERYTQRNASLKKRAKGLSARQIRRMIERDPKLKALMNSRTLQRFLGP